MSNAGLNTFPCINRDRILRHNRVIFIKLRPLPNRQRICRPVQRRTRLPTLRRRRLRRSPCRRVLLWTPKRLHRRHRQKRSPSHPALATTGCLVSGTGMELFGFGSVAGGRCDRGTVRCGLAAIGCGTDTVMSGSAVIGAERLR